MFNIEGKTRATSEMRRGGRRRNGAFITCCARLVASADGAGVPGSVSEAAGQMRGAVRRALAAGKRRVNVDVLVSGLDVADRGYDENAARAVLQGLVSSTGIGAGSQTALLVAGSEASVAKARTWASEVDMDEGSSTSVHRLTATGQGTDSDDLEMEINQCASVVIMIQKSTNATAKDMLLVRKMLRACHAAGTVVVVYNHAKESEVYEMLGFGGAEPVELGSYEDAFVIAPFALYRDQDRSSEGQEQRQGQEQKGDQQQPVRFVLQRQFPGAWGLWLDSDGVGGRQYELCAEFQGRPEGKELQSALMKQLGPVDHHDEVGDEEYWGGGGSDEYGW